MPVSTLDVRSESLHVPEHFKEHQMTTERALRVTPELYTIPDFLSAYSLSRTELYRQAKAGRIKLTKLGSATRIARADAEAWMAALPVKRGGAANEN